MANCRFIINNENIIEVSDTNDNISNMFTNEELLHYINEGFPDLQSSISVDYLISDFLRDSTFSPTIKLSIFEYIADNINNFKENNKDFNNLTAISYLKLFIIGYVEDFVKENNYENLYLSEIFKRLNLFSYINIPLLYNDLQKERGQEIIDYIKEDSTNFSNLYEVHNYYSKNNRLKFERGLMYRITINNKNYIYDTFSGIAKEYELNNSIFTFTKQEAFNNDMFPLEDNIKEKEFIKNINELLDRKGENKFFTYENIVIPIPFDLTEDQLSALDKLINFVKLPFNKDYTQLFILTGYAGTGKTTILDILNKYISLKKIETVMNFTTTTHPANEVLETKTTLYKNQRIKTIDSYLGLSPELDVISLLDNDFRKKTTLVIDESSMLSDKIVDLVIGESPIHIENKSKKEIFIKGERKIIFVGDPLQLAPVGNKTISKVFLPEFKKNHKVIDYYELTTITRTGDSPLLNTNTTLRLIEPPALNVNNSGNLVVNQNPTVLPYVTTLDNNKGIEYIKIPMKSNSINRNTIKFASDIFLSEEYKNNPNYARIICGTNKYVDIFNDIIRKSIVTTDEEFSIGDYLMSYKTIVSYTLEGKEIVIDKDSNNIKNSLLYKITNVIEEYNFTFEVDGISITLPMIYTIELEYVKNNNVITYLYYIVPKSSMSAFDNEDGSLSKLFDIIEKYNYVNKLNYEIVNTDTKMPNREKYDAEGSNTEESEIDIYNKLASAVKTLNYLSKFLFTKEVRNKKNKLVFKKSIDYPYAQTIHKSQGSTYNIPIIHEPSIGHFIYASKINELVEKFKLTPSYSGNADTFIVTYTLSDDSVLVQEGIFPAGSRFFSKAISGGLTIMDMNNIIVKELKENAKREEKKDYSKILETYNDVLNSVFFTLKSITYTAISRASDKAIVLTNKNIGKKEFDETYEIGEVVQYLNKKWLVINKNEENNTYTLLNNSKDKIKLNIYGSVIFRYNSEKGISKILPVIRENNRNFAIGTKGVYLLNTDRLILADSRIADSLKIKSKLMDKIILIDDTLYDALYAHYENDLSSKEIISFVNTEKELLDFTGKLKLIKYKEYYDLILPLKERAKKETFLLESEIRKQEKIQEDSLSNNTYSKLKEAPLGYKYKAQEIMFYFNLKEFKIDLKANGSLLDDDVSVTVLNTYLENPTNLQKYKRIIKLIVFPSLPNEIKNQIIDDLNISDNEFLKKYKMLKSMALENIKSELDITDVTNQTKYKTIEELKSELNVFLAKNKKNQISKPVVFYKHLSSFKEPTEKVKTIDVANEKEIIKKITKLTIDPTASYSYGSNLEEIDKKSIDAMISVLSFRIPELKVIYNNNKAFDWSGRYLSSGIIEINLANVKKDTLLHEIAHPIIDAIEKENRPLFNNLLREIHKEESILKSIKENPKYKGLSDRLKEKEAIVTALGLMSANLIDPVTGKGLISALKKLLAYITSYLKKLLKLEVIEISELSSKLTINDLSILMVYSKGKINLTKPKLYKRYSETKHLEGKHPEIIKETLTLLKKEPLKYIYQGLPFKDTDINTMTINYIALYKEINKKYPNWFPKKYRPLYSQLEFESLQDIINNTNTRKEKQEYIRELTAEKNTLKSIKRIANIEEMFRKFLEVYPTFTVSIQDNKYIVSSVLNTNYKIYNIDDFYFNLLDHETKEYIETNENTDIIRSIKNIINTTKTSKFIIGMSIEKYIELINKKIKSADSIINNRMLVQAKEKVKKVKETINTDKFKYFINLLFANNITTVEDTISYYTPDSTLIYNNYKQLSKIRNSIKKNIIKRKLEDLISKEPGLFDFIYGGYSYYYDENIPEWFINAYSIIIYNQDFYSLSDIEKNTIEDAAVEDWDNKLEDDDHITLVEIAVDEERIERLFEFSDTLDFYNHSFYQLKSTFSIDYSNLQTYIDNVSEKIDNLQINNRTAKLIANGIVSNIINSSIADDFYVESILTNKLINYDFIDIENENVMINSNITYAYLSNLYDNYFISDDENIEYIHSTLASLFIDVKNNGYIKELFKDPKDLFCKIFSSKKLHDFILNHIDSNIIDDLFAKMSITNVIDTDTSVISDNIDTFINELNSLLDNKEKSLNSLINNLQEKDAISMEYDDLNNIYVLHINNDKIIIDNITSTLSDLIHKTNIWDILLATDISYIDIKIVDNKIIKQENTGNILAVIESLKNSIYINKQYLVNLASKIRYTNIEKLIEDQESYFTNAKEIKEGNLTEEELNIHNQLLTNNQLIINC